MLYARYMFAALQKYYRYQSTQLPVSLKTIATRTIILGSLYAVINTAYAAEDTIRGSSATTMPHPELVPLGIRLHSFILFPGIIYSLNYNDNVFATESNAESAYVSELNPSMSVNSDWNNHALNFSASALDSTNHEFSSEDYTDWDLEVDGTIDISRDSNLRLGVSTGLQHIARSAPDDERGTEPTAFDRTRFFTRYSHRTGRLVSVINLSAIRKEYHDVDAIRLGVPVTIDNSDRDRTEAQLKLRIGYRYVADEQFFVTLEGFDRDYDTTRNFSDRDQSSTGTEVTAGVSFDYHGIVLGEIALGRRTQDYEKPLRSIDEPIIKSSIRWNVTDLTTANFNLDYEVRESVDLFFSGYTSTTASLGLDHELRRNLVLNTSLGITQDDYVGIDPAERKDDTYYLVVGSTYRMNRNLFVNLEFTHLERKSDLKLGTAESSRFDFSQNLISFQLQAQF